MRAVLLCQEYAGRGILLECYNERKAETDRILTLIFNLFIIIMDFSIIIAQVLGIFFVVTGISIVANGKSTAVAVEESAQNKGILFMWGILALLIGAVIVVFNNEWTSGLTLLVTILGWLAIAKGTFILLFPGVAAPLYKKCGKSGLLVAAGVVIVVLGLVLLYW